MKRIIVLFLMLALTVSLTACSDAELNAFTRDVGQAVEDELKQQAQNAIDSAKDAVGGVVDDVKGAVGDKVQEAKDKVGDLFAGEQEPNEIVLDTPSVEYIIVSDYSGQIITVNGNKVSDDERAAYRIDLNHSANEATVSAPMWVNLVMPQYGNYVMFSIKSNDSIDKRMAIVEITEADKQQTIVLNQSENPNGIIILKDGTALRGTKTHEIQRSSDGYFCEYFIPTDGGLYTDGFNTNKLFVPVSVAKERFTFLAAELKVAERFYDTIASPDFVPAEAPIASQAKELEDQILRKLNSAANAGMLVSAGISSAMIEVFATYESYQIIKTVYDVTDTVFDNKDALSAVNFINKHNDGYIVFNYGSELLNPGFNVEYYDDSTITLNWSAFGLVDFSNMRDVDVNQQDNVFSQYFHW
jgi:hypothetical protein